MRRIMINMQNALFSNAISETLRRSGNELDPYTVDLPDKVVDDCKWIAPYALLMEVTGYTPWKLEERMKLRDTVKALHPDCKIVLIVDENAEDPADTAESRLLRKAIMEAVETLPPEQQEAIIGHFYHGLPLDMVDKKQYSKALQALRKPEISIKLRGFL